MNLRHIFKNWPSWAPMVDDSVDAARGITQNEQLLKLLDLIQSGHAARIKGDTALKGLYGGAALAGAGTTAGAMKMYHDEKKKPWWEKLFADKDYTAAMAESAQKLAAEIPPEDIPPYCQVLTAAQRATHYKFAHVCAAIEAGVRPATINESLTKEAEGGSESVVDTGWKLAVIGSLLTGVPLGAMAHVMGQRSHERSLQQQEMEARTKFFRNASQGLESGLAQQGAVL